MLVKPNRDPDFAYKNWYFYIDEGIQEFIGNDGLKIRRHLFNIKEECGYLCWSSQQKPDKWRIYDDGDQNDHEVIKSLYVNFIADKILLEEIDV